MVESTQTNCEALLGSLSEYIEGELDAELCLAIEKHIAECDNCRIVVDTIRKTVDLVHTANDPRPGVPEDVRERLFKRLNLEDYIKPASK